MKNITITIDDEVYRAASEEAAQRRKSLSELVQEFIERMSRKGVASGQLNREELGEHGAQAEPEPSATVVETKSEEQRKRREEFAQFFAELNARPRQEGPSVGPLNRQEIYQRGVRGY